MIGTIRIGRFFGFEVNIHWSWIFIFFLVTGTVAELVLPDSFPRWTAFQRWSVAAFIAIVFFLSILLHELSHAIVARRSDLPVSSITLFVFGGVSNLTKEPSSPRQEFWIAIVGPLTSILVGALFGAAYFIVRPLDKGASDVLAYLGFVNIAIGVFNLIPGFPLDGGRVLRSIFWARNRNMLAATRLASRVGQIVANVIMALGVVIVLVPPHDVIGGLWFFLIGNFLRSSSTASYEQLFIDTVLKGIPAAIVMRRDFVPLSPEMTLSQLVEEHVLAGHGRAFPVMAGEELLGLVTLTDTRRVPRDDWATVTVYRAMTPVSKLQTVAEDADMATVLILMAAHDINQVPVLDGRLLKGMIHRGDVVRYIQTRQEMGTGAPTH